MEIQLTRNGKNIMHHANVFIKSAALLQNEEFTIFQNKRVYSIVTLYVASIQFSNNHLCQAISVSFSFCQKTK